MDKYAIASNAKNTPMKGILLKVSGNTVGRPSIALPTKSEPIKPERPVPKIVKARPVATWFVASPKTKNPKIAAVRQPDIIPASNPTSKLPDK